LAAEVLQRLADAVAPADDDEGEEDDDETGGVRRRAVRDPLYADRRQEATASPARIPEALPRFADAAIVRATANAPARQRALGEVLSEPKPGTWFERGTT